MEISMKKCTLALFLALVFVSARAQYAWQEGVEAGRQDLARGLRYGVELQGSASHGKTPLWLNANRYGLSSLDESNGYVRGSVIRPLATDSARRWGIGYGLDVAAAYGYTSIPIVQQAFVEARWLHGVLSVGSKYYPMQLRNNALSSGAQTLGINARPVPQVRLALPEYWTLPFLGGWLHMKGHVSFGKMTDADWQRDFTLRQSRHTDGALYHSKAGYLMIGNPDRFFPWSVEMGLEMAALFGGVSYVPEEGGVYRELRNGRGVRDFWNAFWPGGADAGETTYQNVEGDQLGSWLLRLNYDADTWRMSLYADKFFEDHSSMLQLDYDGYGSGGSWGNKERRRYLLYDFKDWMLGAELNFKYGRWLRNLVAEYLYTKYQSGPIYHDHSRTIPDHIGGTDNYYNHYIYPGWSHWGQVMGNPLYRSPIYNEDGVIEVRDNRFVAFHLGLSGSPTEHLDYRLLATWQAGWGTYDNPYTRKHHNVSLMLESTYHLGRGWKIKGAYGMDFGHILGNNYGAQLTLSKSGFLNL